MNAGQEDEMIRAARNQVLYRTVNEKIEELNQAFDQAMSASGTWICECADQDCNEPLELTLGEYEELRSHPNRFAVLPGHVYETVERVVEKHENYVVVEKLGVAKTYAIAHDLRGS